ncbi:fumarylacetoacetate hydrolase family protein [Sutcliffiella cohnii]
MKLITFMTSEGIQRAGWISEDRVYDMYEVSEGKLPNNMLDFLKGGSTNLALVKELAKEHSLSSFSLNEVTLKAPIPNPPSVRDFMAFEEHLVNAGKRSGIVVAPEWYEVPAFYFTNHLVLSGDSELIERPPNCKALDYELEIACIIGKEGKNIKADEADEYILGYTIFNDWSARDFQMKEMKIGLGPAKGKDFATTIGPYIVTKDELELYLKDDRFHLEMLAKVNGKTLSKGNAKDMYYSFGQMIERASAGVTLYPGDVIGSGTVGTGCILELGTDTHRWLEPGDEVELEISGLGSLKNKII